MLIVRTPNRIPLGGGGTDLPFYASKFGGSLITAAINKYIYTTVHDTFANQFILHYSEIETPSKVDEIKHPLIREAMKLAELKKGVEITTMADVPARSGLGSSGSFTVGLLNALHSYKRGIISSKLLAEQASTIEMDILKEPVGKQDNYAAAYGGIIQLEIGKNGKVKVDPLNLTEETIKELETNLMIFYTGITRHAGEVIGDQKKQAESEEDKLAELHQIKKIGLEIKKVLEKGDTDRFGRWLNMHWETKKRTSSKISNPQIDKWYDHAMKNGALGGKIMGAGGGGFFMFYCPQNHKEFRKSMTQAGLVEMPFRFDFDGSKVIINNLR